MKGVKILPKKLGPFMKEARINAGMTLQDAGEIIGFCDRHHLWKVEQGLMQFPTKLVRRACSTYKISLKQAVLLLIEDASDSIKQFFLSGG